MQIKPLLQKPKRFHKKKKKRIEEINTQIHAYVNYLPRQ